MEVGLGDAHRQCTEGSDHHPLRLRGPLLHDGRSRFARKAVRHEVAADLLEAEEAHVDDDRLPRPRESLPIEIRAAVLHVARDEHARLRVIAMRERNAGVGCGAQRCGDSGDDLERDSVGRQRVDLLAAAAEDERIAAFQAQHALARERALDEERIDRFLAHRVIGPPLADVDALRARRQEREDIGHMRLS
jgi:hypothetical protein